MIPMHGWQAKVILAEPTDGSAGLRLGPFWLGTGVAPDRRSAFQADVHNLARRVPQTHEACRLEWGVFPIRKLAGQKQVKALEEH